MQSKKLAKNKPSTSTQKFIDIAQIQDDTVILKDGTLRSIILTSSINFALKSEDEQKALVSSYVNFLNSLRFPISIVIQSRKLNIDTYLDDLDQKHKEQTNELLRIQIGDYRNFVAELVELGDIMSKRFFVIVPYSPISDSQRGFFERFQSLFFPASKITLQREKFLDRKEKLSQRVQLVLAGLQSMGLNGVELNTQNLIELYYESYNPELSESQKLQDIKKMQVERISGKV